LRSSEGDIRDFSLLTLINGMSLSSEAAGSFRDKSVRIPPWGGGGFPTETLVGGLFAPNGGRLSPMFMLRLFKLPRALQRSPNGSSSRCCIRYPLSSGLILPRVVKILPSSFGSVFTFAKFTAVRVLLVPTGVLTRSSSDDPRWLLKSVITLSSFAIISGSFGLPFALVTGTAAALAGIVLTTGLSSRPALFTGVNPGSVLISFSTFIGKGIFGVSGVREDNGIDTLLKGSMGAPAIVFVGGNAFLIKLLAPLLLLLLSALEVGISLVLVPLAKIPLKLEELFETFAVVLINVDALLELSFSVFTCTKPVAGLSVP
jgi:hypothetical protein